jgi:predicted nucleotidyltransferase
MTDVLFIAKSGADAYGWAKKDSDLDLRLVWVPNWKLTVGLQRKEKAKQIQKLALDITHFTIHHFFNLLCKGNGNCLENLFQPKIFEDTEAVNNLQKLSMENLHVGYLKHWLGYSHSLQKDMKNTTRIVSRGKIKPLLDCYRVLQSGIILATREEVIWNIVEQNKIIKNNSLEILSAYMNNEKITEKQMKYSLGELKDMQTSLGMLINFCKWKEINKNPFNSWLGEYYKRMRE